MRQAITTRYMGPTNYRPGRVKAMAQAGSVTLEWDHALNTDANHARAAKALRDKFDWQGVWFGAGLPGAGYVYVDVTGQESPF